MSTKNLLIKAVEGAHPKKLHPDEYKIFEKLVARFLATDFPQLQAGKAFRTELFSSTRRELDIVIDLKSADWIIESVLKDIESSPPLAHIEVSYRNSKSDPKKVIEDLSKIHKTVLAGADLTPPKKVKKVWTAFVGLGASWTNKRDKLIRTIHEYFHDKGIHKVSAFNSPDFWNIPDIIIFPGLILKKHQFVPFKGATDSLPVYCELPSAINDPAYTLRPLAIARGFFHHFLRGALKQEPFGTRAWPKEEVAAIMGPNVRKNYEELRAVCLQHGPLDLFAEYPQDNGRTKFLYHRALKDKCCHGKFYRYERQKDNPMDETFLD